MLNPARSASCSHIRPLHARPLRHGQPRKTVSHGCCVTAIPDSAGKLCLAAPASRPAPAGKLHLTAPVSRPLPTLLGNCFSSGTASRRGGPASKNCLSACSPVGGWWVVLVVSPAKNKSRASRGKQFGRLADSVVPNLCESLPSDSHRHLQVTRVDLG